MLGASAGISDIFPANSPGARYASIVGRDVAAEAASLLVKGVVPMMAADSWVAVRVPSTLGGEALASQHVYGVLAATSTSHSTTNKPCHDTADMIESRE